MESRGGREADGDKESERGGVRGGGVRRREKGRERKGERRRDMEGDKGRKREKGRGKEREKV